MLADNHIGDVATILYSVGVFAVVGSLLAVFRPSPRTWGVALLMTAALVAYFVYSIR